MKNLRVLKIYVFLLFMFGFLRGLECAKLKLTIVAPNPNPDIYKKRDAGLAKVELLEIEGTDKFPLLKDVLMLEIEIINNSEEILYFYSPNQVFAYTVIDGEQSSFTPRFGYLGYSDELAPGVKRSYFYGGHGEFPKNVDLKIFYEPIGIGHRHLWEGPIEIPKMHIKRVNGKWELVDSIKSERYKMNKEADKDERNIPRFSPRLIKKISVGMSEEEVENILGPPAVVVKGLGYTDGKKVITVMLRDGKVWKIEGDNSP